MRGLKALLGVLLVATMCSCLSPERVVVRDLPEAEWRDSLRLTYLNSDTTALHEVRIVLRLDNDCREDSLTLRMAIYSPDSLTAAEYHRLLIERKRGAAPLQRIVEVPYRRGVQLQRTGAYHFVLTPTRPMKGVEAVGLKFTTEQ